VKCPFFANVNPSYWIFIVKLTLSNWKVIWILVGARGSDTAYEFGRLGGRVENDCVLPATFRGGGSTNCVCIERAVGEGGGSYTLLHVCFGSTTEPRRCPHAPILDAQQKRCLRPWLRPRHPPIFWQTWRRGVRCHSEATKSPRSSWRARPAVTRPEEAPHRRSSTPTRCRPTWAPKSGARCCACLRTCSRAKPRSSRSSSERPFSGFLVFVQWLHWMYWDFFVLYWNIFLYLPTGFILFILKLTSWTNFIIDFAYIFLMIWFYSVIWQWKHNMIFLNFADVGFQ